MTRASRTPEKTVSDQADDAVRKAGPVIQRAARFGLAIQSALYLLVGLLALQAAARHSSHVQADKNGAFVAVLRQPFGRAILFVIAAGCFAYALWRILSAVFDLELNGREFKAILKRTGHLFGGMVYAGLGAGAIRTILGYARAASADQVRDWTAWAMHEPLGRYAIAAAAIAVAARGVWQIYRGFTFDPLRPLATHRMGDFAKHAATVAGRLGLVSRGLVFLLVASFLMKAAFYQDPSRAHGLGASLAAVERAPYGQAALCAVALGLIAFGLYALIQARYRFIRTQPPRR